MILDVFHSELQVSVPLREVVVSQVADEALRALVKASRERDLGLDDQAEDLKWIIMHEGALTLEHLKDENTKGIPVHSLTMALVHDDLWGEVLRSSADSVGALVRVKLFDESKVRKLQVAGLVDQYVLRLEVPVNETFAVEVLEAESHLASVKARETDVKLLKLIDKLEELTSVHILHHEVQGPVILLDTLHVHLRI